LKILSKKLFGNLSKKRLNLKKTFIIAKRRQKILLNISWKRILFNLKICLKTKHSKTKIEKIDSGIFYINFNKLN